MNSILLTKSLLFALMISLFYSPYLPTANAKPARIVSINLCTDQLLLAVAPKSKIVALSHSIKDRRVSAYHAESSDIPLIRARAEEIIIHRPDLVFGGPYTNEFIRDALKRLGIKLVSIPIATNFSEISENIKKIGKAIGENEAAVKAIIKLKEGRPDISQKPKNRPPLAAIIWPNSLSSGPGTLPHSVLVQAGFENLSARLKRKGTHSLLLETILENNPDYLVFSQSSTWPALATRLLSHPALIESLDRKPRVRIKDSLWLCGTPATKLAVEAIRNAWNKQKK
jgi:iron complex transport system substrate-binding protein